MRTWTVLPAQIDTQSPPSSERLPRHCLCSDVYFQCKKPHLTDSTISVRRYCLDFIRAAPLPRGITDPNTKLSNQFM